jgi:hypothetical protein
MAFKIGGHLESGFVQARLERAQGLPAGLRTQGGLAMRLSSLRPAFRSSTTRSVNYAAAGWQWAPYLRWP